MLFLVVSGFLLALFAPALNRLFGPATGWVLALLPAALTYHFAQYVGPVADGETFSFVIPWISILDLDIAFYVDGLSLVFALLICGIGTFIVVYSGGYLKGHRHVGRFYGFILAFMASMLGLVLADHVFTLFVFWELTSITSFLLIGYLHDESKSRRSAVQALVVTGGGGLAMLAGLILLASVTGEMRLSAMPAAAEALKAGSLYLPILVLILCGAFSKSAQFPLHFWLPNAMAAPTPVSAYLHSATMVKAGVYLMARMNPTLGGTEAWLMALTGFGGVTLLLGAILALRQSDLKLMLAYTTVASLGLLTMLIGLGTDTAIKGMALYLIAHALFKGAFFMIAGAIDHEAGTREIGALSGLRRAMPITFFAAVLAFLSMSGVPPLFGFYAKETLYLGTTEAPSFSMFATIAAVAGNALMMGVAGVIALRAFLGTPSDSAREAHEAPISLWLGPVVLGLLALALGIASVGGEIAHYPSHYVIAPIASAIAGAPVEVHLHAWAGFNLPLLLSAVTLTLGALMIWQADALRGALAAIIDRKWGFDRGFDQALLGLMGLSRVLAGLIQTGHMRQYMLMMFLVLVGVLSIPLWLLEPDSFLTKPEIGDVRFYELGFYVLAAGGALAVVFSLTRLRAIVSLGSLGFAVAVIFLLFGAPDLSFTQFMVETLAVVVLALVLTRLPVEGYDHRHPMTAILHTVISVAVGVLFMSLIISVLAVPFDDRLSDFFTASSYPQAHGRNIVNVIIVDFRGLDTLGEITVVLMTGIASLALIRLRATSNGRRRTGGET